MKTVLLSHDTPNALADLELRVKFANFTFRLCKDYPLKIVKTNDADRWLGPYVAIFESDYPYTFSKDIDKIQQGTEDFITGVRFAQGRFKLE